MSTHKQIDLICVAVLVCTLLITILFMNGESFGLKPLIDGDAVSSSDSAFFTDNDRKGDWSPVGATRITLSGDHASITGGGAYAYDGDVVIAQAGRYVLSGTLDDGCIIVDTDSSAKVWIMLNGADIHSADNACLRIEQADKVFLTLAADTENSMSSGAVYSDEAVAGNVGGTIFSRDDLTVNGSGSLRVTASYKQGIDVNDELVITGGSITVDAPQDGIHVNDGLRIEQASLTIHAGDEGLNLQGPESLLYIESGTLKIESTGSGIKNAASLLIAGGSIDISTDADGLHSGGDISVQGGSLSIRAGDDGIRAESAVDISGGSFDISADGDGLHSGGDVSVQGGSLSIRAGDDGIHADNAFEISDGSIAISECYEGIEALTINISGGEIEIYPSDDGMNANGGTGDFGPGMFMQHTGKAEAAEESETWIHISGGSITVVNSTARDADGLDSNGDIVISGGVIRVSLTSSGSNNAIDYGSESGGICQITGGELVACGSSMMAEGFSDTSTQCAILYNLEYSAPADTAVVLKDAAGTEILSYTVPCDFSSVSLSSPELKLGETYTISIGQKNESITVDSVSTAAGIANGFGNMGGGMGWSHVRQRGADGSGAIPENNESSEGGERRGDMGGRPGGFAGQPGGTDNFTPPSPDSSDMSAPPAFDGETPFPSDMSVSQEFGGQAPVFPDRPQDMEGRETQHTQAAVQDQDAAEEAAELALEEQPSLAPQPVTASFMQLIGGCVLALALGILLAAKYRQR